MDPEYPYRSFFLFINSGSGGGVGDQMLGDEVRKFEFEMLLNPQDIKKRIDVHIFNMRENREKGFRMVRQLNERKAKTVVIICGGDGTVMWVISEFIKYKIDPEVTPLAIIPLGTGNDFSRSLGWGGSAFLFWSVPQLKTLVKMWCDASEEYFDLWDMTAQTFQDGYFMKVENFKEVQMPDKVLKKTFCNYFSFGIDGKVGYSFDKHRTGTRLGNMAVYGAMGAMSHLQKNKDIDELVENLYIAINPDSPDYKRDKLVFTSKNSKLSQQTGKLKRIPFIDKGQMNVLALNINSYTGGVADIWKNARVMLPIESQEMDNPPTSSDQLLEIVSFDSTIGIATERILGGMAKKVTQSSGPFRFNFHQYTKEKDHHTFLQIDGEFIKFVHPKSLILRKSALGRVKVLKNNTQKWNLEEFIKTVNNSVNIEEVKKFNFKNMFKF